MPEDEEERGGKGRSFLDDPNEVEDDGTESTDSDECRGTSSSDGVACARSVAGAVLVVEAATVAATAFRCSIFPGNKETAN